MLAVVRTTAMLASYAVQLYVINEIMHFALATACTLHSAYFKYYLC